MTQLVALTGASGFIGRTLAGRLIRDGWGLRALVRRPDPDLETRDIELVRGSLEDNASLERLVAGASAVVHCAGIIKARSQSEFNAVNAEGTARIAAAARNSPSRPRVLFVSSLAARQPSLSAYAESKWHAEQELSKHAEDLDYCVLRPPAVYGPGDRVTLPLFRQLVRGIALVPLRDGARFSLLYVNDLADAVAHMLSRPRWGGSIFELDDRRPGGYSWPEIAEIAGRSLGRPIHRLPVPRAILWFPALFNETVSRLVGRAPTLTRGKLHELYHPDWKCSSREAPLLNGWKPSTDFNGGVALTVEWYRHQGWL